MCPELIQSIDIGFSYRYIVDMTDFLFSKVSAVDGIAANIDLYGIYTEYNLSENGNEADSIALLNDWLTIGKHISTALHCAEKKVTSAQKK